MNPTNSGDVAARIRRQRWDQGCLLDRRIDLFLADLRTPLTAAAIDLAHRQGVAPRAVVEVDYPPEQSPGMVVVSQLCDLVASDKDEPMCEAIPLVAWPSDMALPGANSSRYFTLDGDRRLVCDQTRRLVFEKALLPDRDATTLLASDALRQSFRAWIARRASRVPFDDDLVDTIGDALTRTLGSGLGSRRQLQTMFAWRVLSRMVADHVDVGFLIPYNEQDPASQGIEEFVAELEARVREHLPRAHERAEQRRRELGIAPVTRHELSSMVPVSADRISLRQLLEYPAFNLEHLTYGGNSVRGAHPIDSELA